MTKTLAPVMRSQKLLRKALTSEMGAEILLIIGLILITLTFAMIHIIAGLAASSVSFILLAIMTAFARAENR